MNAPTVALGHPQQATPEQSRQVPTETYLLDALLAHGQAVTNQFVVRGRMELAEQLAQLLNVMVAYRDRVDAELSSGILRVSAEALGKLQ